jgi:putative NADH-flavin reductase
VSQNARLTCLLYREERTLKLVVLGATGGTGLEIVRQAIERGHSVTAFARSPERLKSVIWSRNVQGHDAVVSGFGPRVPISKNDANLRQQFAVALTMAMLHAGVSRVVVESVALLFRDSLVPPTYLFGRLFFPGIVADSSAMERVFRQNGVDWTFVRPPQLTGEPYTGKYRVREGHLPPFGFKISRADVADFMVRTVEDYSSINKIVGIST